MRERLRGVPASLGALLVATLLLGLGWAILTPAFQAPDEQSHFAYAQYFAETGKLPGDPARPIYSSEHIQGAVASNADQVADGPQVKPEWSDRIERAWASAPPGTRRADDGGGPTSASSNPPASYAWEGALYRVLGGGDLFDHVFDARLASVLWLPVTVLGTWLLAGEVFGRRRLLQLTAAAVPALLPMVTFISGSVSPEGMLYALWALALWLGVRILQRGMSVASIAAFAAVVALACVTKATSYALVPGLVLVLVVGLARARPAAAGVAARLAAAAVPLVVVLGGWFVLARSLDRPAAAQITGAARAAGTDWGDLASYLWQYYLPALPGMHPFPYRPSGYPLFQIWIKTSWAAFGWLKVRFPDEVYRALAVVTVAVLAGGAAALWRARRRVDLAVAAFLALAVLAQLAGLHWTDYHFLRSGSPFMQGRYVFPVLPVGALALAGAVSLFGGRGRRAAAGAAIGGLVVFHVACVGLVLERFYA